MSGELASEKTRGQTDTYHIVLEGGEEVDCSAEIDVGADCFGDAVTRADEIAAKLGGLMIVSITRET